MPQRQVNVTLATYIDEAGVCRHALQGATVNVHPGHVERFDRLNVLPGSVINDVLLDSGVAVEVATWVVPEVESITPEQLELDTPAPKRTRRKAPVNKGE